MSWAWTNRDLQTSNTVMEVNWLWVTGTKCAAVFRYRFLNSFSLFFFVSVRACVRSRPGLIYWLRVLMTAVKCQAQSGEHLVWVCGYRMWLLRSYLYDYQDFTRDYLCGLTQETTSLPMLIMKVHHLLTEYVKWEKNKMGVGNARYSCELCVRMCFFLIHGYYFILRIYHVKPKKECG